MPLLLIIYKDCGVNITEINPDYVREVDSATPQPEIAEAHNLVECVCKEEIRKVLFAQLAENEASGVHCLAHEGINNYEKNYNSIVVSFSLIFRLTL